jgi:YegS/Rv2252/BmrU family lipid kinase
VNRRFALLVNPRSAGGRPLKVLPTVRGELDRDGTPYRVIETRSLEHARKEARAAADAGETVATLGGDGFVGPIAGELRHRDTALAVLPGGRGNDFARVLGIPQDPAAATRVALNGHERQVDVASVDGAPYLGIASFGLDSDVQDIANETKLVRGNLVYAYATVRGILGWRMKRFMATIDGDRHEFDGYSIAVANTGVFGGGMHLVPGAELDDGELDVLLISRTSKLRYLRGLTKVFKGEHLDPNYTRVCRGSVVEVSADLPFTVYADGDPIATTPATMRVERRCLRVIVPA